MDHNTSFFISEFTNPSGAIVFQLYARLDGKRFRKNFPTRTEAEAERQKMERLRKLRLEREAAEKLAAVSRTALETETAVLQREHAEKTIRNNLKATPSQLGRRTTASTPRTLSEWIKRRERDGGSY